MEIIKKETAGKVFSESVGMKGSLVFCKRQCENGKKGREAMLGTEVIEKLREYGQEHLMRYYEEYDERQKAAFEKQLSELDFSYLDVFYKMRQTTEQNPVQAEEKVKEASVNKAENNIENVKKTDRYEPLFATKIEEIERNAARYEQAGIEALKQYKVGAVLLAGGQGTRLGFDHPKGMFNIGVTKELYIFERIIDNLMDVVKQTGCPVPLFIMTSEINDEETRNFFKEKKYFGYDEKYVFFFVQSMAPSISYDGRFYLSARDEIALSPNGNGGWFSSMVRSGLLSKMEDMGIEWLNVFSVDNVLQRIADPRFVGATILSGLPSSAKVVKKADPQERVGVMCKKNGKPSIVEYYELTEQMMNEKDESGEPAYNYGVILNYMFRIKDLLKIVGNTMTTHMVEKKIPYIDEKGELVTPAQPNGYKFEKLILDMINMLDDCLVYEVERKREFAPVKNKEGVDSIDTARQLLRDNGVAL